MTNELIRALVMVDHAVGHSGPHRNVVSSLNALSRRGDVRVRLLCCEVDHEAPYARAPETEIRSGFQPHSHLRVGRNLVEAFSAARGMDLIYVPSGLKAFLYAFLLKRTNRKLVAGPNVTGIPVLTNMYNPGPMMTCYMADRWIEMSEVRVTECISAGTPRERISFVPHSVDTTLFNPCHAARRIWKDEGVDPNRVILVHVGSMHKELKGIPVLVDAFRRIRERTSEVELVIIGELGPELERSYPLPDGLHCLGARFGKDLPRLLASADVFMGASRYETFWLTPLEAMASGLPIVVSNVGAVPTMIPEDGIGGRVVQVLDHEGHFLPDAPDRICEAALPLIRSKSLRIEMGLVARKRAEEHFSEALLGDRLVGAFRNALGK